MKSIYRNLSLPPINNNISKANSPKKYRGSTLNTTSNQKRAKSIKKDRIQTNMGCFCRYRSRFGL